MEIESMDLVEVRELVFEEGFDGREVTEDRMVAPKQLKDYLDISSRERIND
jgi:hypothetical protein